MLRRNDRVSPLFFVLLIALQLTLAAGQAARADWLFSYPPNQVNIDSGKRNNVFYTGDPVVFTLSVANYGTYAEQGPLLYEVRDYWGTVVAQGTTPAPTFADFSLLTLPVSQPGWYKLYLHQATSQAPWGDSVGSTMFVIFRPNANFPVEPSPTLPGNSGVFDGDEVARGVTGMGPQRHPVTDASQPDQAIAQLDPSIALDKQYYTPFDPQRSRPLLIAFPNGISSSDPVQQSNNLAGLQQIVQHYHNDVKYWEPLNEPNFTYSGADYVNKELKPFYQTIKSVDPTCKVLGPGVVTIGPDGLAWIEDFLEAGGANYIDAFSFHAYNNVNGDLTLARESLDSLSALLTEYGIPNIEKWQTEQGYFAAVYGSYQPRLQGRWTMLQMMVFEQYGIPKEHNHLWYDVSHGYWDFPAFWENADGPSGFGSFDPAAPLMRVWSEELYGTNFVSAYDFGALGNKMYVGSLFGGPGKQVAAFMSAGRTDGAVTLSVSAGNSIHVVSAFGVEQDLPVTAGQVTLPVPELPVYVELAPGQTIQVTPIDFGQNLTQLPGTVVTASGTGLSPLDPSDPNDISKVINGTLENWYWAQGPGDHPWMDNTVGFPAWVQVTFPVPVPISHVVVYAGVPWQHDSSLVDYELQYDSSGQWVTLDHVQEPTTTFSFFSPPTFTTVDSFYSDRCLFEHDFPTVTTQKIRLLVHNTTFGGGATENVVLAGGQADPNQYITLREIEAYSDGVTPLPVITPPTPQGLVRFFPRLTCAGRMPGGKFQGSADGVAYTDLYTITSTPPEGQWTEATLTTDPQTFRYLRYLSPDGSYGNIAELEFYSGTGDGAVKITGTPFGTSGSYQDSGATFDKVFDGDTTTYFDAPGPDGNYVGIDQGPTQVTPPVVTAPPVSSVSLTNGSFETLSVGPAGSYLYDPVGAGWTFSGSAGLTANGSAFTSGNPSAPDGAQAAFVQVNGSVSQTLTLAAGTYTLSFSAAQRGNWNQGGEDFSVLVDGAVVGTFKPDGPSYTAFLTSSFTVTAGSHTLTFQGLDTAGGDNTAFIDQVQILAVTPSLITNGSFETPSVGPAGQVGSYLYDPSGAGWTFTNGTGGAGIAANGSAFTSGNPAVPDGVQAAFVQMDGSVSQTLTLPAGTYTLSFSAAQRGNWNQGGEDFSVLVDGAVVGTFKPDGASYVAYATGSFSVTTGSHTLTFQGLDTAGGDNTAFIDQIQIATAP